MDITTTRSIWITIHAGKLQSKQENVNREEKKGARKSIEG